MKLVNVIIALCMMFIAADVAWSKVLFAIDQELVNTYGSRSTTPIPSFSPTFEYYPSFGSVEIIARVFQQVELTLVDVGTTFEATAANDPGFVGFANLLTDGQEQYLYFPTGRLAAVIRRASAIGCTAITAVVRVWTCRDT